MRRLFFLLMLLALIGCEPGDLVDLPYAPRRITVLSFNEVGQPWYIQVAPTEHTGFAPGSMEEAIVKIYDNGDFLEQLEYDTTTAPGSGSAYASSTHSPEVGHTYKIVVENEGYETVTSEYTQPEPVPADIKFELRDRKVQIYPSYYSSSNGLEIGYDTTTTWTYNVSITFTDPPGENYYDFWIKSAPSKEAYDTAWIKSGSFLSPENLEYNADPLLSGQMIDDKKISEQTVTLKFTSSVYRTKYAFDLGFPEAPVPGYFIVSLRTMNAAQYKFITTARRTLYIDYDPYAQPITTFTNVEHGLGVFGGYTPYSKEFTFAVDEED